MANPDWRLAVHGSLLRGLTPAKALDLVSEGSYQGVMWQLAADSLEQSVEPLAGVQARGLEITGLSFLPEDANPVPPERAAELAEAVGAPWIRVVGAPMRGQSYAAAYDATLRVCQAYSEAAQRRGRRVLLHQRWGTVTASASQMLRVLSHFDPSSVGCVYDAGSMTIEGYEEYRIGLERLGSYVADVHIANTRHFPSAGRTVWEWEWSSLGDGLLDLQRLFRALRHTGYQGWVTLADRSEGLAPAALLAADRQILQQAIDDFEGIGSHNPVRPLDDHVDRADRPDRSFEDHPLVGARV